MRLLLLLFGGIILCFILTALSSTDPATYLVRRGNLSPTPEVIEPVSYTHLFAANLQLVYFLAPGLAGLINGIIYVLLVKK